MFDTTRLILCPLFTPKLNTIDAMTAIFGQCKKRINLHHAVDAILRTFHLPGHYPSAAILKNLKANLDEILPFVQRGSQEDVATDYHTLVSQDVRSHFNSWFLPNKRGPTTAPVQEKEEHLLRAAVLQQFKAKCLDNTKQVSFGKRALEHLARPAVPTAPAPKRASRSSFVGGMVIADFFLLSNKEPLHPNGHCALAFTPQASEIALLVRVIIC